MHVACPELLLKTPLVLASVAAGHDERASENPSASKQPLKKQNGRDQIRPSENCVLRTWLREPGFRLSLQGFESSELLKSQIYLLRKKSI